jgi:hypothetical protein
MAAKSQQYELGRLGCCHRAQEERSVGSHALRYFSRSRRLACMAQITHAALPGLAGRVRDHHGRPTNYPPPRFVSLSKIAQIAKVVSLAFKGTDESVENNWDEDEFER